MARKKFSCDFETTTNENDCRVWAYGYREIGNKKNRKIGNSLDEFMVWLMKSQADIYFHNLKFDGSFIVNWLLRHGYKYDNSGNPKTFNALISGMGQWYMIDICQGYKGKRKIHTVIYDSLKKLPFPVKAIAKGFNLEIRKGDIDYHKHRPIGYKIPDDEKAYIDNDIDIVGEALETQFKEGLTKMTNGSDSLAGFKDMISRKNFEKLFPVLDLKTDDDIRKAYRGGFTWLNEKHQNKILGEGLVFDVNSLYPSIMYNKQLPYGQPVPFEGEYEYDPEYPLYIQNMECEFRIKDEKIPTIQIKKSLMFKPNEYLKNSDNELVEMSVTNVDLKLIREHYDLFDVTFKGGYKFKQKQGIFNSFIDKWTYVKTNNTGAKKLLAKLMLNSLYGKFASNPDVTGKVPYLKEDGALGFRAGDDEMKDPVYTAMGAFVTSYARELTIRTAQKCFDRIIYCDTDSIHLTGTEIPDTISDMIDDNKLGYWAHESTFKKAKYLRQKTYLYEVYGKMIETDDGNKFVECNKDEATTSQNIVKCAGMTDNIKEKVTFDNFEVGFSSNGKLLQKQVNGGAVLVDREFTIK